MKTNLVLLVEDNPSHIALFQFILKGICELQLCNSPEDFFLNHLDKQYDLILMDIGFNCSMLNGVELSKKIKSIETQKNTPIIAITAYIFGDITDEIFDAKNDGIFKDIILKPIENIESFRNTIKNYLN